MSGAALSEGDEIVATINVTPLVDITLVLLIVFMVSTTLIENPVVPVDLPTAENTIKGPPKSISLIVDVENKLYLDGSEQSIDQVRKILESEVRKDPETKLVLGGDGKVKYQNVMTLIDLSKKLGIRDLMLNVQPSGMGDGSAPK